MTDAGNRSKASRKLLEELPVPAWTSGADGQRDYVNKAYLEFTGSTTEKELGEGWANAVHPDDIAEVYIASREAVLTGKPYDITYRLKRHDGKYRWVHDQGKPRRGKNNELLGFVGSFVDVTETKMQTDQLAFIATHDPLTELPNRRILEGNLERAIAKARRGTKSALMYINLDGFHKVNDALGHDAGDRALKEIAAVIAAWLRQEDLLVRLDGDEFAALLEGQDQAGVEIAAERMRKAVNGYREDDWNFSLSLSIGIAMIYGGVKGNEIMSRGDEAMNAAKEAGRNRVTVFGQQTR